MYSTSVYGLKLSVLRGIGRKNPSNRPPWWLVSHVGVLHEILTISMVSARNAWHNDPRFVYKIRQKSPGVLPEKLGGGWRHASWNPYPISDQNLLFSLPYFRPEALEPGAWPERVTSCYDTYMVGVNIKREMVLSPNVEEVASSKKHTQFKTSLTNHTLFQTKMVEIDTLFQTKTAKKHTLWRREKRVADYESRCLRKRY